MECKTPNCKKDCPPGRYYCCPKCQSNFLIKKNENSNKQIQKQMKGGCKT